MDPLVSLKPAERRVVDAMRVNPWLHFVADEAIKAYEDMRGVNGFTLSIEKRGRQLTASVERVRATITLPE